jgi:hypothetical protein
MGAGDDDEPQHSSAPAPRFFSEQFDAARRHEEQARAQAWSQQNAPQWYWIWKGGLLDWKALVLEFPHGAPHGIVFAAEHAIEHGRLLTWCVGCRVSDCGACKWARQIYLQQHRADGSGVATERERLPF